MSFAYRSLQLSFALVLLALAGCAATLPVNYAPSSVMSAEGSASVDNFAYAPALSGKVKPNQIRNTAMGNIHFEQNIDLFFKEAVFKELRFVGVKLNNDAVKVGGEIEEFLIDDLGYSVDWTLRVRYDVTGPEGRRYSSVKTVERNTNKFANVFGALNETIKLNVEEVLKDPEFLKAIRS